MKKKGLPRNLTDVCQNREMGKGDRIFPFVSVDFGGGGRVLCKRTGVPWVGGGESAKKSRNCDLAISCENEGGHRAKRRKGKGEGGNMKALEPGEFEKNERGETEHRITNIRKGSSIKIGH